MIYSEWSKQGNKLPMGLITRHLFSMRDTEKSLYSDYKVEEKTQILASH